VDALARCAAFQRHRDRLAGPIWAAAAAKFETDTGLPAPKELNWNDPTWRRWISWRYGEITNFVQRIASAAKSATSDIAIIVENSTIDHNASTMLGLEGSRFKANAEIIQVWEVDVLSDQAGMAGAQPDDWISMIGMTKFAKAASGPSLRGCSPTAKSRATVSRHGRGDCGGQSSL
jgi:hypothetical protein